MTNDKTLQEQFDRAEEDWIKANADREKFNTNKGLEDWCKAAAEFDRIKERIQGS